MNDVKSVKDYDYGELFLPDEYRMLDKTLKLREEIVDTFIKEKGIPTKGSEIRVINELLDSIDNNVLGRVDRRLKHVDNKNNENMAELVKEIIKAARKKQNSIDNTNIDKNREIDIELSDDDVVPDEDTIGYIELNPDEFQN